MTTKVAVLSDLHCHPGDREHQSSYLLTEMGYNPPEKHPIAALVCLIEREDLDCDALVAPGDFTDRISREGFHRAWSMVREVGDCLGGATIIPTLGNHDVDSRDRHEGGSPYEIARRLHRAFLFECEERNTEYWADGVTTTKVDNIRFVIINSVPDHYKPDLAERGMINDEQLRRVESIVSEREDHICVAVCHHHPIPHHNIDAVDIDLMNNGERLAQCLSENDASLLVHGHKHYPRLRYAPGGTESVAVFAAGSLAAYNPATLSNTRNTFHVITFPDESPSGCRGSGKIDTWEFNYSYGWRRRNRQSADFPPVTGFGFRGDIDEVADRCASTLEEESGRVVDWSVVVDQVPEVQFLVPGDFDRLRRTLRQEHGAKLYWGEVVPELLGWVV